MGDRDLRAFRDAWRRERDGRTGQRYVQALCAAGREVKALRVCQKIWGRGDMIGLTEAAWIEKDRHNYDEAIRLMTEAARGYHDDDEDRLSAIGVAGHMRWHFPNDPGAEEQLREGKRHYSSAWADLGNLLVATDRAEEAEKEWREAVEDDNNNVCMLPLANLLARRGDTEEAEELYRRGYALGDAHSAWNLACQLGRAGRDEEADEWRWKAALGGDELAIRHLAEADDRD